MASFSTAVVNELAHMEDLLKRVSSFRAFSAEETKEQPSYIHNVELRDYQVGTLSVPRYNET